MGVEVKLHVEPMDEGFRRKITRFDQGRRGSDVLGVAKSTIFPTNTNF